LKLYTRSLPLPAADATLGSTSPFLAQKLSVEYGTPVNSVTWRGVNPISTVGNIARLMRSVLRCILHE
jgi:hypothetical protein